MLGVVMFACIMRMVFRGRRGWSPSARRPTAPFAHSPERVHLRLLSTTETIRQLDLPHRSKLKEHPGPNALVGDRIGVAGDWRHLKSTSDDAIVRMYFCSAGALPLLRTRLEEAWGKGCSSTKRRRDGGGIGITPENGINGG